jgi:hypothetical protein
MKFGERVRELRQVNNLTGGCQFPLSAAFQELRGQSLLPIAPRSDHSVRHGLTAGPAALNIFSAASFCRARGESETETAREASVRGDKPFERPARRISRGRCDRASERLLWLSG